MKKILTLFVLGLFLLGAAPLVLAQGYDVETPPNLASETGPGVWNALRHGETKTVTSDGRTFQVSVDLSRIQAEINAVKSGRVVREDAGTKLYEKLFTNKEVVFTVDSDVVIVGVNGKVRLAIDKPTSKETLGIEITGLAEPEKKGRALLQDKSVFNFQDLEIYQNTLYTGFTLDVCPTNCRLNNPPEYTCYGETSRFLDGQTPKVCWQGNIMDQKAKGESCTANVECQSNECVAGKCGSMSEAIQEIQQEQKEQRGLLNKIVSFLKKLFGFD